MDNESEWGDWIEHDGRGCPCVGEYGQVMIGGGYSGRVGQEDDRGRVLISSNVYEGIIGDGAGWYFGANEYPIVRYRIRKPRSKAMDILRSLVHNPDQPINAPAGPVHELTPA